MVILIRDFKITIEVMSEFIRLSYDVNVSVIIQWRDITDL